ncbi:MAG: DUF58 domain-containing protein [Bergeyella sp.]|nr:DUF58 domain-containing protein [Bergeyella sp.]
MDLSEIIKKIRKIQIKTRRKTHTALFGEYRSVFKGQGMTFSEVRPYQPGDEVRRIDWNKTAHFRMPYVKVMEEERECSLFFLVDVSASMRYGTKETLKKNYAAEICASLGFSAAENNDKVGLVLFSDEVHKILPPKKGARQIFHIISQLLRSDHYPCISSLDKALEFVMKKLSRKSFVVVISDFEDPFSATKLSAVAKKHVVLGIKISDEKEREMPDIGLVLFRDIETGRDVWINTSNARWRYEYREQKKAKNKNLKSVFDNFNAGFIELSTGEEYTKLLQEYFRGKA